MKPVLIACERSQIETTAFLEAGYDAYSCDIVPTLGNFPDHHIIEDAAKLLVPGRWGLIIAHPPCTYLSAAGGRYANDPNRIPLQDAAREFFYKFYNFRDCPMCIENPRPLYSSLLPKETQEIHPYYFGSPFMKRTFLWLYKLPFLLSTCYHPNPRSFVNHVSGFARSKSFPELASAFVNQWSPYIE